MLLLNGQHSILANRVRKKAEDQIMATTKLHDTSDPELGAIFEAAKRGGSVQFSDMRSDHGDVKPQPPVPDEKCSRCGGAFERDLERVALPLLTRCTCAPNIRSAG